MNNEVATFLEEFLKRRAVPVHVPDSSFFGIKVVGHTTLDLGNYVIIRRNDQSLDEVASSQDCSEEVELCDWSSNLEGDEEEDEDKAEDDQDLDFTACSLDDCGYCGECMY